MFLHNVTKIIKFANFTLNKENLEMNTILVALLAFVVGGIVAALVVNGILKSKGEAALAVKDEELTAKESEAASLRNDLVELRISEANLRKEVDLLRESAVENDKRNKEQLKEQMEALKLAFGESANKIFEEKAKGLAQANEKEIKTILDPLKEKMEEFRQEVKDSKEKSIKNSASIEQQIKVMMEKAATLGQEANNLATALKGNNKVQGNWGETHLEKLLQDYGFIEGVDYVKQELVRDSLNQAVRNEDTGRKMIPDFTLTFPDNKVVVIDSKVSFTAYLDYCNAEDEVSRENALGRHIESVRAHIKELSRKDYSHGLSKGDKESLKYVIMYVPNETAFQLFFRDHQDEWRGAFDKGVIVTGDLYLITMLKIIRLTWDENTRRQNTEKILDGASELLNRVGAFVETFEGIGSSIKKMEVQFDAARGKLYGRQSVATTSRKLEKLGVECKKPIQIPSTVIVDEE